MGACFKHKDALRVARDQLIIFPGQTAPTPGFVDGSSRRRQQYGVGGPLQGEVVQCLDAGTHFASVLWLDVVPDSALNLRWMCSARN